jgi:hypothetical protein
MRKNPDYRRFLALQRMVKNHQMGMGQERLDLAPMNALENAFEKHVMDRPPMPQEMRVHAVGGRVLPASTARYGFVAPAMDALGIPHSQRSGAEEFAQNVINKLPKRYRDVNYNFDVAPVGNSYKIIESNPASLSGFLFPGESFAPGKALMMNRYVSALQGQATRPLAALHAGGAGLAGMGALGTYDLGRRALNSIRPNPSSRPSEEEEVAPRPGAYGLSRPASRAALDHTAP